MHFYTRLKKNGVQANYKNYDFYDSFDFYEKLFFDLVKLVLMSTYSFIKINLWNTGRN